MGGYMKREFKGALQQCKGGFVYEINLSRLLLSL